MSFLAHTSLFMQNITFVYYLKALVNIYNNNLTNAYSYFEKVLVSSQHAINEIFSVRNEFLFAMIIP